MTTPLPKLVRDRIPELIEASGRTVVAQAVPPAELPIALLAKLREETAELAAAPREQQVEELADVHEVVRALAASLGVDWSDVLAMTERKAAERGRFARGLMLVDVSG